MKFKGKHKKIYYIAAVHKWDESDAASRHILEICRQFKAQGISVSLFVPDLGENKINNSNGLKIISIPVFHWHPVLTTISFQLALIFKIGWVLKKESKPVFYGRHNFLDCLTLFPLRLFFNFDYISEINGIRSLESNASKAGKYLISFFERCSLKKYSKAVAVTDELKDWAEKYCKHVLTIPNGVDTDFFKPQDKKTAQLSLHLETKNKYINFTGSLKSWHGTKILINALPHIISNIPSVRLLIIGDGPEKDKLKTLSEKNACSNFIIWVGRVSKEKVATYLNASDLCIAPINNDAVMGIGRSSLKVFEYMASGKPFVTMRTGTTYDKLIEKSRAGILVNNDTPIEISEVIVEALMDEGKLRRLGLSGRKFVENDYSWKIIGKKIVEFIITNY